MPVTAISGYRTIPAGTLAFSDTDWPSTANRPTFAGSTLTWVGPSGGGPNNGTPVRQTRVLGNSSQISTSGDNQVIEGLNITTGVLVNHNNVTIRQCRMLQSDPASGVIIVNSAITGLVVEDCLLDGQKNTLAGILNSLGSVLGTTQNFIRRNHLTGFENHMTFEPWTNVMVRDNYLTACANAGSGSFDGDMIELYTCDNVTITHNMFDGSNSQASPGAFNSMLNLSNLGPVTNVAVTNNMFANCAQLNFFVICDGPDFGGGLCTFSFVNNGFFNRANKNWDHGIPATSYTISPDNSNYEASLITDTSGPLIAGTGIL